MTDSDSGQNILPEKDRSSIEQEANWRPSYSEAMTFCRLPLLENPGRGEADLAVLGIPWDDLVTYRPGARFGPEEIRQFSVTGRSYSSHLGVSTFEELRAVDAGDVDVSGISWEEGFRRIEDRVDKLQNNGIAVVALGGDHSVLLPILRALARNHPGFTLIQVDAHTDTSDTGGSPPHHHGTVVRDAINEGLVTGPRIFQIGIRGTFGSAGYLEYGEQAGINVLDMHDFNDAGAREKFVRKIRETAGDGPCYLTFDIDGVDPAFAPGTGTPVPGGLSSFQAIDLLRDLKGLRFVGADVVEVAPVYDHPSGITSLLGANIALQLMALIALGRSGR